MGVKKFLLKNFVRSDEAFHLARVTIHSRHDLSLHKHDFAEIFWVENGSGTHLINDRKIMLEPGHLVMIRPDDQHTFTSVKGGITLMNLAFSMDTLHHLRSRYFAGSDSFFWTRDTLPYQAQISVPSIRRISQRAEEVLLYRKSSFHLDYLLLFIFRLLSANDNLSANQRTPAWLNQAIKGFSTPPLFKQGVRGFADLAERNIDHVNRTVQRTLHKTLTDLVTELRMKFAARQLSITNVPIKIICNDCGFTNLGHFYKTFKQIYQQTPSAYRKSSQTIV
jgi:AraC-like DNA-binding protein/mannose-6-phosphate isomerase-like protein (cupin superfamily)